MNGIPKYEDLAHSWGEPRCPDTLRGVVDETIRDGLQMPYAPALSVAAKCEFLDHMIASGISDVIVGMVQREDAQADLLALLRHCRQSGASIQTWILSRLNSTDIEAVLRLRDAAGIDVGANVFVSLSALRMFVEGWREQALLGRLDEGLTFARRHFSQIRLALEDATRTPPAAIAAASRLAADHRVTRLVIADTAGVATPEGVAHIFEFLHTQCPWLRDAQVGLEWHGHNDRGLAIANSLESIACGAHYVHGTMLGIGERNGNAALDSILLNLSSEIDFIRWDPFHAYQQKCHELFGQHLKKLYPFFGEYTFASATGTHCAAARKAIERGRSDLSVLLYSPPSVLSRAARPRFLLSPMSGRGAALAVLEEMGLTPTSAFVDKLIARVREINRTIEPAELKQIIESITPLSRKQSR